MSVSNSNLYTCNKSINEAQVCVENSCFSKPESPACKTKEIRDNSKNEEIQDENDQDIYVPRFFIPPIPITSIGHAVDVEHAETKSVSEAQVCVDNSFLSKSESPDSESKEMGSMEIERSIASGKKCGPDKDAFNTYDGLKKSKCYTMTEVVAVKESKERTNEISVIGSTFQFSSPHIKNRRRSASSKQKYQIHGKPTASGGTFNTIRVRLNKPLTQDTLKYYFENSRKSGGGDIKTLTIIKGTEIEVEEVLITFAESKYAMNCCQQDHILSKMPLDVQKYEPNDLWEMDKALVTGLNPVTTEDTLMNFLEPAAGVELKHIIRGVQEDAAIVVFAEKPDFAKLSKQCKEKTLEGKTICVQLVEKCQTIYVKGIDKSITYDQVDIFFCNKKKSGGGDVEKVDYHPEDGYCIVYFEHSSDAKNTAAKGKFTINDREVQAQLYFPCLGLPEQPMNWDDMPCVYYEGNEYIVKFVKNCPKECSQIEEALQKKFVKVEWPKSKSDFIVKLQCTVTQDVENAKEILKSWKESADAEMDSHMKKYVCRKHSTVPEAWSALLAQLKTLTIDQPDRVAVFLVKKNHTVIVAGYKENTEALTRIILYLIKICSEKCRTDRKVVNLSQQQFRYIKYFGQYTIRQIKNACTSRELEIKENELDCSIEITGNDEDVKKAYEDLTRFIKQLREDSCSIYKPGAKMFFNSSKGREAMKKAGKETFCIILNKDELRQIKENRESGSFRGHKRRTSYSLPITIAECKLQFCDNKFIVMKGDVTKLKVDVLVNAANGDLDHCGGLALAISRAGGKSIQEESNTYIASNRIVPDGEAIPAQPGELPCKRLLHAVGPRWRDGSHNEEKLLKKAILKCLELTDKYKHSSIAIPALSAGFFGYPVAESVKAILDAIELYVKIVRPSSIKEVYFCDVDDTIVKEFVKCLKRKFGLEVKEFSEVQQSPVQSADSDSEEEKPRRSWPKSDNLSFTIKVISGELAKMRVDVIVSSTDKSLNLTLGATSKSLLLAGGESLQEECIMKYRNGVQPGEVAMIKGGNLYCRQVYYGAIKKWDHYQGDALSRFTEFVDNCLQIADRNWMSSMAFPALGTGRLGYPPDLVAKTMFKCCIDFLRHNSSTSLKEITIVVYDEDKETFQIFRSVLSSEDMKRRTETSS